MFLSAAIVGDCSKLTETRKESIVPIAATLNIDTVKKKAKKNPEGVLKKILKNFDVTIDITLKRCYSNTIR